MSRRWAEGAGRRWGPCAAGLVAALALLATERLANATRPIFIWFADGGLPPASVQKICLGRPPAFQCPLGASVDACRDPVVALLQRWYADFDVVFTFAPPPDPPAGADGGAELDAGTGSDAGAPGPGRYDTVVVASDGAWCGADPRSVSRSPLPPCADPGGGGAVAIFRCADVKACATLIAKEQAHLVGLQHTGSATDVMNEQGFTDHDGFEDRDNQSAAPKCGVRQNSYRLMLERLGAWAGGPKPGPGDVPPPNLPGPPDAGLPPDPAEDAGAGIEDGAAVDLRPVAPDAGTGSNDGAGAGPGPVASDSGGGCSCQLTHAGPGAGARAGIALIGLLAALAWRRRRGRRFVSSVWRGNPSSNRA